MQDQLLDMLMNEDEITWQTILMDLIKSEEMDPWNVDVSLLANRYIGIVKKLKEANLGVSGKVLLASALLLKVKSNKLVEEDLLNLDRMIAGEDDDEFFDDEFDGPQRLIPVKIPKILLPKVPQPRKRKVSVYDLIDALQKALNVTKRRKVREIIDSVAVKVPEKKVDISVLIEEVFERVHLHYVEERKNQRLKFSHLVPSEKKEDVVYTLQPLLHLSNQKRVGLKQPIHFGDIDVTMIDPENPDLEFVEEYEKEQDKIPGKIYTPKKKSKNSKKSKPKKGKDKKSDDEQEDDNNDDAPEVHENDTNDDNQNPPVEEVIEETPTLTNDPQALEAMDMMNGQIVSEVYGDEPPKLKLSDLQN